MSELEKQIANRVVENADLQGAEDLIDAQLDTVGGGACGCYCRYCQYCRCVVAD